MTTETQEKVLRFMLKKTGHAMIKVRGISMLPVLKEGDDIQIAACEKYAVGDILVYNYNGEGLLVHRLLGEADVFVCKGDNAFRIEKIGKDEVLGKVTFINGERADKWELWKVDLSLKIGKSLLQLKNLESVKNSSLYQMYATLVLKEQTNIKVSCSNTCKSFVLEDEKCKCLCVTSNGKQIEYTGIDAVIIFFAIQEKQLQSFVEDVLQYFTYGTYIMKDEVYYRMWVLVEDQIIVLKY